LIGLEFGGTGVGSCQSNSLHLHTVAAQKVCKRKPLTEEGHRGPGLNPTKFYGTQALTAKVDLFEVETDLVDVHLSSLPQSNLRNLNGSVYSGGEGEERNFCGLEATGKCGSSVNGESLSTAASPKP
jgi:hypothetical protein